MYLLEESQDGVDGKVACRVLHIICLSGIYGECLCAPYLPVVVEQGGVEWQWLAHSDKRHTEKLCCGDVLISRLEHAHMRYKLPRHIEARHLHAILEILDIFKHRSGNTLGGLSLAISWEHTVDVGAVHCPKPLRHVHREGIARGNDQYTLAVGNFVSILGILQRLNNTCTDILLLYLVASHRTHYSHGFLARAKPIAINTEIIPIRGFHLKYSFNSHGILIL